MNDRLPGVCWDNPIWYRDKWRIYIGDYMPYEFVHDDYDGAPDANDNRCGHANSVEDAKAQIDDMEEDA